MQGQRSLTATPPRPPPALLLPDPSLRHLAHNGQIIPAQPLLRVLPCSKRRVRRDPEARDEDDDAEERGQHEDEVEEEEEEEEGRSEERRLVRCGSEEHAGREARHDSDGDVPWNRT